MTVVSENDLQLATGRMTADDVSWTHHKIKALIGPRDKCNGFSTAVTLPKTHCSSSKKYIYIHTYNRSQILYNIIKNGQTWWNPISRHPTALIEKQPWLPLVLRSAYLSPQKSREEKVTSLIPTLPVRRVPSRAWTSLDVAEPIQCLFI